MALIVERTDEIGFCFGVKRCIEILEKVAQERGQIESLGTPVHNQQVLARLASHGVKIAHNMDEIQGNIAGISAHGVGPLVEAELRARCPEVINTTCPFVHRAQIAAQRLAKAGFFVLVYGDASHVEVKGILGWANNSGIATIDESFAATRELPRRLGILAQTTSILPDFIKFVKRTVDAAFVRDSEVRIIDTICHDIRERQRAATDLARKVDVMLVIGSRSSANSNHLAELCSTVTRTYLVQTPDEIQPAWFGDGYRVGVTSGASTPEETTKEVLSRLKAL